MRHTSLDEADKKANEASQGTFLKLENDGDKAVGVFVLEDKDGNLVLDSKETIFNEKTNRTEDYKKEVHQGNPSTKFLFNFYVIKIGVKAGDKYNWTDVNQMKVGQLPVKSWKLARAAQTKFTPAGGKIRDCVYEIERKGKAKDSNTIYTTMPEEPKLVKDYPGLEERIKNAKFFAEPSKSNDESSSESDPAKSAQQTNNQYSAQNDTISMETAEQLMARLKVLPEFQQKAAQIFGAFSITRLRDLKNSDFPRCHQMIEGWEKPAASPPANGAPVGQADPFQV